MTKRFISWMVGVALAIGIVLFPQLGVFAKNVNGVKYSDNDYHKIVLFLNQKSAIKGRTNAEVLGWNVDDPKTWHGDDAEINWDDNAPKRIRHIGLHDVKVAGELDVSTLSKLYTLGISFTSISSLNAGGCTDLKSIVAEYNKLEKINLKSSTKLKYLRCNGNNLTSLNVSKNKNLKELACQENKLTKLNLGKKEKLTYLNCGNNKLTELNVRKSKNLEVLYCYKNNLTKLDLKRNKLSSLNCYKNLFSKITVKMYSGKKITLKTKGEGSVGLIADEINGDYAMFGIYATVKSDEKFVNWTQKEKLFSKKKVFYGYLDKSYNLVAHFN